MKSILQSNKKVCFLCAYLHEDYHEQFTHCHHAIYGSANRKLSEKHGLKYYLCPYHHEFGAEAVHHNKEINLKLKKAAELTFISRYSFDEWMRIFGMNYLEEDEKDIRCSWAMGAVLELDRKAPTAAAGFEATGDPVGEELPF